MYGALSPNSLKMPVNCLYISPVPRFWNQGIIILLLYSSCTNDRLPLIPPRSIKYRKMPSPSMSPLSSVFAWFSNRMKSSPLSTNSYTTSDGLLALLMSITCRKPASTTAVLPVIPPRVASNSNPDSFSLPIASSASPSSITSGPWISNPNVFIKEIIYFFQIKFYFWGELKK